MENPFSPVQPRYNPDTGVVQFRHMAGTKSAASRADLNDNMVMPDQKPDPKTRIAIMRAVEHQRSPFFLWLLGLHDDLIAESLGRISWKPLIERALELGLVDGSNKAPTARRAAKVWVAVRQEAALRMSRPATSSIAVAPSYPSRTPASWTPPLAATSPSMPVAPKSVTLPPAEAATAPNSAAKETPEQQVERVLGQLRERANRRNGIF